MEQKGVSMKKLALDLNLSEEEMKRYYNNLCYANSKILKLVSDYFDISSDYLLGRTDNPDSHKEY